MKTKLIFFGVTFVLAIISAASGQVNTQPYRISDREVVRLLDRIKNETNTFRKSLKDALNKSRFDRTRREDDINTFVKNFEDETSAWMIISITTNRRPRM